MPAKSESQERLMQAVAHSPEFARKVDIPQSVGREFTADRGGLREKLAKYVAKRKK